MSSYPSFASSSNLSESCLNLTHNFPGPLFLGYADFTKDGIELQSPTRPDWENLAPHGDEEQVRLDVDRSFVYYPKSMFPMYTRGLF